MADDSTKKLGVIPLAALVVSAMIGGGIFSLPQNMAQGAGVIAVIIAWIVTGIGMYFIANTFRVLADARPDATTGIMRMPDSASGGSPVSRWHGHTGCATFSATSDSRFC